MLNKLYILATLLIFTSFSGKSQTYVLDSLRGQLPAVVNESADTLAYADSSVNFSIFFQKLDSIHKGLGGKLHIMHIGGSHVQADVYSGKLRNYFQQMNSTSMGQRGFIFPYNLAGTNNPLNYRVEGNKKRWKGFRSSVRSDSTTWGLSGITVNLTDSIDTLRILSGHRMLPQQRNRFNRVRFFVDNPCSSAFYKITDSSNQLIKDTCYYMADTYGNHAWTSNTPAGISQGLTDTSDHQINAPDHKSETPDQLAGTLNHPTITPINHIGFRELTLAAETDTLQLEIIRQDSVYQLYGIELMSDREGIEYTSIGVNGASFESYARCTLFKNQMALYMPDLFIIAIGTNDAYTTNFDAAKYEAYYRDFLAMILEINPQCAILLTVPNDNYYKRKHPNRNTAIQQEIIHRLGKENNMAVWDLYEIMGGLCSSQKWYLKHLMPRDRIHFTATGYSLVADLLLKALTLQWEKSTGAEPGSILKSITFKAI